MMDLTRIGRCYELAGRYASSRPAVTLVHGTIQGYEFPRIGHAWVELADGAIYEPTTDQVWDADVFGLYFRPKVEARYRREDLLVTTLRTGHWGPWREEGGDAD